jgi:ankyrin repeat protein
MDKTNQLFEYIKNSEWDKFESSLNNDIDLDIKDNHSNYLIQYIILYNNVKILQKVLQYNLSLDWLDNEGRSILYIPIKYGYINIIKILLQADEEKIGISILNIKDSYGNFPLHYALFFKNLEIFKLLSIKSNFFIFDKAKNSIIHLVTKNKNIDFLKTLTESDFNINITNSNNETPLHIACVYDLNNFITKFISLKCNLNIKEKSGGLTPLMICVLNNNIEAIDLILSNNPMLDLQDYEGNTVLHLALIDNNYYIANKIIRADMSLNANICNLDGNTYLHIILYKMFYDNINQSNYPLIKLFKLTNLNIQNNDGQTCWHFIIATKLFAKKEIAEILIKKKNNLFILDKKNKTPYDVAKSKLKKEELDLLNDIIASSYWNGLKISSLTPDIWSIDWEKICSKPDSNKDKCLQTIKKYISLNNVSIPLKRKTFCIDIENPKNNIITTFTGIILDIITCYIVLQQKFNVLSTSITTDYIINQNVLSYYKQIGIVKELFGDYLNFELFWLFHKDIWPTTIEKSLTLFISSDKRIFALPVTIDLENGSHSNVIIIDKELKIIERFEPNGSDEPIGFNYNKYLLDFKIKTYLENFFPDYEYLEPGKFLPTIGFQVLEMLENKKMKRIGDPGGFCVGWCLWYLEQRIKYIIHPKKLVEKLIINIKVKNISFKNLIRSYVNLLLSNFRDKILNELDIDINDIINENISETKSLELEKTLTAQIANL